MPKALEKSLAKSAKKAGLKGEKKNAYIYGTLNKISKAKKK